MFKFTIDSETKNLEWIEIIKFTKNLTQYVTMICNSENMNIQLMDDSHVSLLNIDIPSTWFDSYNCEESFTFSFNNNIISKILSLYTKNTKSEFEVDEEKFYIHFLNNNENKYFQVNLVDIDSDILEPQMNDTDLDFSLSTKVLDNYLNDLSIFGENIEIQCVDDRLKLITRGDEGELNIDIQKDKLDEFNVVDDYEETFQYSMKYIQYITKLKIIFTKIHLFLDKNSPLRITFDGDIKINYFVAPKVEDD